MSVDSQILEANAAATAATNKAITYTDAAQSLAQGEWQPFDASGLIIGTPSITNPEYKPNVLLADTFKSDFQDQWTGIDDWLTTKMTNWVTTYFPMLDPALITAENAWLLNVINNGYIGIPAAVDQMLWDRARSKDAIEALRLEDDAVTQFSSRGFSLPAGVLANRTLSVQQDAANKSSTIARDQAIKQVEIAVDMVKFAIQQTTQLRLGIAGALADFIRAYLTIPQIAQSIADNTAKLHDTLWTASNDYTKTQIALGGLTLDTLKSNQASMYDYDKLQQEKAATTVHERVAAAMEAARQMGSIASSARGATNTLVGAIQSSNV